MLKEAFHPWDEIRGAFTLLILEKLPVSPTQHEWAARRKRLSRAFACVYSCPEI